MDKVLVIEHGKRGSAKYIIDALESVNPEIEIEATDPIKASQLLDTQKYDLVVVDEAQAEHQETLAQTSELPKVMTLDSIVLFVLREEELEIGANGITFRKPWVFATPDSIFGALRRVLDPAFREHLDEARRAQGLL